MPPPPAPRVRRKLPTGACKCAPTGNRGPSPQLCCGVSRTHRGDAKVIEKPRFKTSRAGNRLSRHVGPARQGWKKAAQRPLSGRVAVKFNTIYSAHTRLCLTAATRD